MFRELQERFGYTLSQCCCIIPHKDKELTVFQDLIRFTYDGDRVRAEQTPEEVRPESANADYPSTKRLFQQFEMADEDIIDIQVQQVVIFCARATFMLTFYLRLVGDTKDAVLGLRRFMLRSQVVMCVFYSLSDVIFFYVWEE